MKSKKLGLFIIITGSLILFLIQWASPLIWGTDGYYHIRLAEMMKTSGFLKSLDQAKFSYFTDRFSDKDWLYHLLLVPFTLTENILSSVKWAAWLFGVSFYASLVVIAGCYVNQIGLILVGLGPFLSRHFLQTLLRPRPMVLGITLGLWAIHWLLQKKEKALLITTLVYGMMHITAPLVLIYGLIIKIYRWVFKEKMDWRLIGAILIALVLSYVVHPNFPNNLFYFYLNGVLVPFFAARWGVLELGAEFFPMNTLEYWNNYPVIILGMILMTLVSLIERPKISRQTQIMFLLSATFVVMGMMSQRYVAHGYPLMILTLGMFASDWSKNPGFKLFLKKIERGVNWIIAGGVILTLILLGSSLKMIIDTAKGNTFMNRHYEDMGRWLKDNVPPGETVFHANWSDSQYFIGINPKNNYLVTMDPVYMWHKDQLIYKLYRDAAFGRLTDPYKVIKEGFKANFGYADKGYFGALVDQVKKDERFEVVKEDQLGLIFKLL